MDDQRRGQFHGLSLNTEPGTLYQSITEVRNQTNDRMADSAR